MDSELSDFRKYGYFVVGLYNGYRSHAGLKGERHRLQRPNPEAQTLNHMVGDHIIGGYIKHQSRHEHEFARHTSIGLHGRRSRSSSTSILLCYDGSARH
jgi:hypothetical protein